MWLWSHRTPSQWRINRVSDRQFVGRNNNFAGVANNWIKCLTPALVADDTLTVFTSCLSVVPVAVIQGWFVVGHNASPGPLPVRPQDQPDKILVGARLTS